jgi:hypothetical protein
MLCDSSELKPPTAAAMQVAQATMARTTAWRRAAKVYQQCHTYQTGRCTTEANRHTRLGLCRLHRSVAFVMFRFQRIGQAIIIQSPS